MNSNEKIEKQYNLTDGLNFHRMSFPSRLSGIIGNLIMQYSGFPACSRQAAKYMPAWLRRQTGGNDSITHPSGRCYEKHLKLTHGWK